MKLTGIRTLVLFILFVLTLGWADHVFAQVDAFDNEVVRKNGKVYFNGKPLTGTLYSSEDNIPNDCDCTLKAQYRNGVLYGVKQEWYRSGKPKYKGQYVNGKKVGTHVYYYPSGKKKKEEKYRNGRIVWSRLYNPDGTPKGGRRKMKEVPKKKDKVPIKTDEKTIKNNKEPVGHRTVDLPSGIPADGLHKEYYPDGQKKRVRLIKDGLIVKDSLFSRKGYPQTIKKYDAGELVHLEIYNENGVLIRENNFLNNKKNGLQQEFFPDGQLKKLENYTAGLLNHVEEYDERGNIRKIENYKFGKKDGKQKLLDESGKVSELLVYDMGKLVKHIRYLPDGYEKLEREGDLFKISRFNKTNQLVESGFENALTHNKEGIWHTYDPVSGEVIAEKAYKDGFLLHEGAFKDGKPNGIWVYYNPSGRKEIRKYYREGILKKTKTIDYAHLLKNVGKENDILYAYKTYDPEETVHLILLRLQKPENTSEQYINKIILSAFDPKLYQRVQNRDAFNDEQVDALLEFKNYTIQLKSKNNRNKKFVAAIGMDFLHKDLIQNLQYENHWMILPITAGNPSLDAHYKRDKKAAFFETLGRLEQRLKIYLGRNFSPAGLAREKKKSTVGTIEVYVNLGKNHGIMPGDTFSFADKQGKVIAIGKVISVQPYLSVVRIDQGEHDLRLYFNTHKIIRALYGNQP